MLLQALRQIFTDVSRYRQFSKHQKQSRPRRLKNDEYEELSVLILNSKCGGIVFRRVTAAEQHVFNQLMGQLYCKIRATLDGKEAISEKLEDSVHTKTI